VQDWWNRLDQKFSCQVRTFFDLFDSYLVHDALMDETHEFRSVVFGWDTMHPDKPFDN